MNQAASRDLPEGDGDDRLSRSELRSGLSLAGVFGLRMLGLFLVLPVLTLHARSLPGGDNLALAGWALGAFALTQAFLQIPFGLASDRFGRKPVIVIGLLIFAAGSLLAAWAPSMPWLIAARALQGAGAIAAAVSALAADLTREQHRTKVMGMIGASIGLMFALSLVVAPGLYATIGMAGIFGAIAALAVGAIGLVLFVVPAAPAPAAHAPLPLVRVLKMGPLLRLNFGVFVLHMVQMVIFLVLPRLLVDMHALLPDRQWQLYLPALLASFALMVPVIVLAEQRRRVPEVFFAAILTLLLAFILLALGSHVWLLLCLALLLFLAAFNVLEAVMPALVSRLAPGGARGAALGVYHTAHAAGAACGGVLGGVVAQHGGALAVFLGAAAAVGVWCAIARAAGRSAALSAAVEAPGAR